jgi:hypothetical protein
MDKVIEKLKSDPQVNAAFITGSGSIGNKKFYSDIDLVVILNENKDNLYCLYKFTNDVFTEVFFFDLKDLERIFSLTSVVSDHFDAIFIDWLKKSEILFDKSGVLSSLKSKLAHIGISSVSDKSKLGYWQRINHNYITDKRYFDSGDEIYLKALEIKLFYSMEQLICSYFAFRDLPWRGEKNAVLYLRENDKDFYDLFERYIKSSKIDEKFDLYSNMFDMVHTGKYKKWDKSVMAILDKDYKLKSKEDLNLSWLPLTFGE